MYYKLRQLCLCDEMRKDHPEWPYPLLFHGHEITRDVFFLDPLIEYRVIRLGRNLVQDAGSFNYRLLNDWFHYKFFNGASAIVYSAETTTLLPRLFRLRRALLDNHAKPELEMYLKRELAVPDPPRLISSLLLAVAQIIQICSDHRLVVWGMHIDAEAVAEQSDYITSVLSKIPINLVLNLPHLREPLRSTKSLVFDDEEELMRKAETRYNRRHR